MSTLAQLLFTSITLKVPNACRKENPQKQTAENGHGSTLTITQPVKIIHENDVIGLSLNTAHQTLKFLKHQRTLRKLYMWHKTTISGEYSWGAL